MNTGPFVTVADLVSELLELDQDAPLLPWHVGLEGCGDLGRMTLRRVYPGAHGHGNLLFRSEGGKRNE